MFHVPRRVALVAALALAAIALVTSVALAAPVTVNVRVEGSTGTLFEGPITTDAETITTTLSGGAHACNYRDNTTPSNPLAGTPTTALHDAALAAGFAFDASWSNSFHDFFVSTVGTDTNGGPPNFPSWGVAVNFAGLSVGGCQVALNPGDRVLWAYDFFGKTHLLELSGPTTANVGAAITMHVTDGQNGQALGGASVGGATTDASGNATLTFSSAGTQLLKATRDDSVRSNALSVCVHNGDDGTCGTGTAAGAPPPTGVPSPPGAVAGSPLARIIGLSFRHHYRHGPRLLRASVTDVAPLSHVRLMLFRAYHRRCSSYDGTLARFVALPCDRATLFDVGSQAQVSYLLPRRLAPGHYVFGVLATDSTGARDMHFQLRRNETVFDVG